MGKAQLGEQPRMSTKRAASNVGAPTQFLQAANERYA
jgi:hypothetical protein